jgi:hypothetical protein
MLTKETTLLEITQALSDLKYYIDVQPPPGIVVRATKVQKLAGYERASELLLAIKALIAAKRVNRRERPNAMLVG